MLVTFYKVEVSFQLLIAQFFSRQEMKGLYVTASQLMLSYQTSNIKISYHQLANYVKKKLYIW